VKALQFDRKVARYAAATVAGRLSPGRGAKVGPLRLADVDVPELPTPEWVRVRPRLAGICGSDLATIDGHSSRYFEPIVSFPFVPGHEVVGDLDDDRRVVVVPILTCAVRGIDPMCPQCATGAVNRCERVAFGHLEPGLQTGFCESTGGGWSTLLVAHPTQVLDVPDSVTDEQAVLIEPTACAVHAAAAVGDDPSDVAVIGSGTLGLLTIAAIAALKPGTPIIAAAKHPHQKKLAKELGAEVVCEPDELARHLRSRTGSWVVDDRLTGGAGQVVDCVGSGSSLQQALDVVAPGGTVHAVGMPGVTTLDLTGLWHREIALRGCYAYTPDDFVTATRLVAELDLGRLVTATYPLSRYEDAIAHAANAGRRGAVKIAFDLRGEKERTRL
jgi:threonine dehydrogenase-like Zn-dependent dehydrogenase